MTKAIIFGVNGQDGFYLRGLLEKQNIEVFGVSRNSKSWLVGNVSDFDFVEHLIKAKQPEYIFHFAANSVTTHDALFENHETISTGTFNILESVYRHSPHSKVFLTGSAVQFENKGLPIDEKSPFAALNPYAVARIQSVYAARYFRKLGLKVYVGYFFHHDSPLRTEKHINQKIVKTVQRIAKGSREKIEIGDITVKKEFNFAGDLIEAVWLLINQDKHFEAVLGSGLAYSIEDWLAVCFGLRKLDYIDYVTVNKNYKPDFKILYSNPELIYSLGWKPKVGLEDLAELMLNN